MKMCAQLLTILPAILILTVNLVCCKESCNAEEYKIRTVDLPSTGDNRIIGGSPATIQEYPFVVQVLWLKIFICGGTLLSSVHVLSAAHCFVSDSGILASATLYQIRVGTATLYLGGTLHAVSSIRVHERYDNDVYINDVALVTLASQVNFATSLARVASIPVQGAVVPDNSSVTAIGWGWTIANDENSASLVLNQVTVPKVNLETCKNLYQELHNISGDPYQVTSSMLCAGLLDVGGKDSCKGDSGGPLIFNGVVVGVTSWGENCSEPQYPGVYARVASYTNWIISAARSTPVCGGTDNATISPGGSTGALCCSVGFVTLLAPLLFVILSV